MHTPFDRLFLASSDRALRSMAESHDFFWGSGIALHNLRWQVLGFTEAYPDATQDDIAQRFANVSGLPGSNAFNLILRRSWDEVGDILNWLRLSNLVSIYESWISATESELGLDERTLEKPLQFRESYPNLATTLGGTSPVMQEVRDVCLQHQSNRAGRVPEMLACYRAFKEARNAYAHGGAKASATTVMRHSEFQQLVPNWSKPKGMGRGRSNARPIGKEAPFLDAPLAGHPIVVTTHGIVGLSGVLRLLVVTLDAEIAATDRALSCAKTRWRSDQGQHSQLPADGSRALAAFRSRWRHAGMPSLADGSRLLDEFRREHIVV